MAGEKRYCSLRLLASCLPRVDEEGAVPDEQVLVKRCELLLNA